VLHRTFGSASRRATAGATSATSVSGASSAGRTAIACPWTAGGAGARRRTGRWVGWDEVGEAGDVARMVRTHVECICVCVLRDACLTSVRRRREWQVELGWALYGTESLFVAVSLAGRRPPCSACVRCAEGLWQQHSAKHTSCPTYHCDCRGTCLGSLISMIYSRRDLRSKHAAPIRSSRCSTAPAGQRLLRMPRRVRLHASPAFVGYEGLGEVRCTCCNLRTVDGACFKKAFYRQYSTLYAGL
jgi:hypothetical protein